MSAPRQLRSYQAEAVQAVINEWGSGTRRTAVVLPTGTGKSSVIAKLATESADMGLRVVMLAHRAELLDQMASTVGVVAPGRFPVGLVRAEKDTPQHQIVAASFQTLGNTRRRDRLGRRDVILCDETHHVSADTYAGVIKSFGDDTFFCGFTATLRRDDGKALRDLIDTVAYEKNLRWAIEQGFLVKPTGLTVKLPDLDLGKVKTTAGDFQNSALAEVMEAETPEVVKAILRHCGGRRPIIFAASVDAAHDIAGRLTAAGMAAEAVTGAMSFESRGPIYDRFRSGQTSALVTVMVLTEGADFPMCDSVVIARPTQSQNLYSQMVGRALRLHPGKTDALVLDLVGTSRVMKLVTLTSLDPKADTHTVNENGEELPPEDDEPLAGIAEAAVKSRRLGPLDTITIDLFGPDEDVPVLWHQSVKGVPFIRSQEMDHVVFLWEQGYDEHGPLYRVATMTTEGDVRGGWLTDTPVPASIARVIAEDHIIDAGYALPFKDASWRRNRPPSRAQIDFARNLGIHDAEEMDRARLSDEITVARMSKRLDRFR